MVNTSLKYIARGSSVFSPIWNARLGAVVAALCVHPFYETDVYWHLALGRAVLRHHARVVPEPMAIPWAGDVCVASEWLWEVVASLLHTSPGAFGPLTSELVAWISANISPLPEDLARLFEDAMVAW